MSANAVIDIAIALILMYLVISLMVTVLNELIATWLGLRASNLQAAIKQLLDNPTLRADFYNHGLIDGANKAIGDSHVSYLSGQTFAMAVVGSLDPTKPLPAFGDVKSAVEHMPDCNVRDALLTKLNAANGDLDKFRNGVATWFDAAMDRVSGAYKRRLQATSLIVGFGLVLILNADSIVVGTALWKDSSIRAQMVQNATALIATAPNGTSGGDPIEKLKTLDDQIRPLPLGWERQLRDFQGLQPLFGATFGSWSGFLSLIAKLFGLGLTTLAVSLGAPFWFDLLSTFVNLRGAGDKPASSTAT